MAKTGIEKVFGNKWVQLGALVAGGLALMRSWHTKGTAGVGGCKKTRRIGAIEMTHPSVYVGTYKKYNNGSLFGEWVDLTQFATYNDFMRYIRKLHKDERDPEFMMQDFEGYPREWYYESGMDEDTFNKIKEYWEAFDGDDVKKQAYEAWVDYVGRDANVEEFEEKYYGTYDSESDYIDEMIAEGVLDPKYMIENWGDWVLDHDAIWRYLDTGGDLMSVGTDYGVAIFNPS